MRFVLYTGALSEHQLPLAREIARRVGEDRIRYVYTNTHGQSFQAGAANEPWIAFGPHPWLESADVMLTGVRDADLFARRAAKGLKTFYMSERWFKPALGIGRLLCLPYFRMARRLVRLMASGKLVYLPMGVWAARDMARLAGLLSGDARCLFRAPAVSFAPMPLGAVAGFPWVRMWGYFVAPSDAARARQADADLGGRALRVLWVGRLLAWKNFLWRSRSSATGRSGRGSSGSAAASSRGGRAPSTSATPCRSARCGRSCARTTSTCCRATATRAGGRW